MTPLVFTVKPGAAADAYRSAAGLSGDGGGGNGFGAALGRAVSGAIDTGQAADAQTQAAITGGANVTDVVTAVSKAELALQTTATIRDRMVEAYQEIMRMPI